MAWEDHPPRESLERILGYLEYIAVEQMDSRDAVWIRLRHYYLNALRTEVVSGSVRYLLYLDVGTTVAMAQLQLLRDGMLNKWPVILYYLDDSVSTRTDPTGHRLVYEVMVKPIPIDESRLMLDEYD